MDARQPAPPLPRYDLALDEEGSVRGIHPDAGVRLNAEVRVGRRRLQKHFAKHLGPEIADLVDLAGAVYLADRLCRRRGHRTDRYEHHWCRRIHVSVPVRKPGIWTDPEVGLRLRELLAFMTEDHWDFSFPARKAPAEEVTGTLWERWPDPPARAALFSGGLDSFAGLCHDMDVRPDDHFILVSGWSHRRLRARQERLRRQVRRATGRALSHLFVECGLRRASRTYNQMENTQPVARLGLQPAVPETISCDSFPLRERTAAQCGHCTSCLLRRQALHVAGLEGRDHATNYKYDVYDIPYWRDHPDHVTFPFSAMRAQVRCLRRALRASDPWAALVMRFPALDQTAQALQSHGVPAQEFRENTLRLYDRHCSEWQMVFGQPRLAASGQPTRGTA